MLLIEADRAALAHVHVAPRPIWARPALNRQAELFSADRQESPEMGLVLSDSSYVEQSLGHGVGAPPAWLGPLLRQLSDRAGPPNLLDGRTLELAPTATLVTRSTADAETVQQAIEDGRRWERHAQRDFANTAHYMGTKRTLLPFIMAAVSNWTPPGSLLVDLMAGSGVVAGAFARRGAVWASDAQAFSRHLAVAQGGGITHGDAADLLDYLAPTITRLRTELSERAYGPLSAEDELFRQSVDLAELAETYSEFVALMPTLPDDGSYRGWAPAREVEASRSNPARAGCLMTAYYANVYFGVRQSIDLDALRCAINGIEAQQLRSFALGALIATASVVATSYGGHFAQPYAPPRRLAKPVILRRVLESRSRSVLAEFEARLLALADHAADAGRVRTVDGPWPSALDALARMGPLDGAVVYVDPPYTRDEYSRYYHVLESLVRYDYPVPMAWGGMPAKGPSGRFGSEFHTRSPTLRAKRIRTLLESILRCGAHCIWSYAADLHPSVSDVVAPMSIAPKATVGAIHNFKAQGGRSGREDHQEILVLLEPARGQHPGADQANLN